MILVRYRSSDGSFIHEARFAGTLDARDPKRGIVANKDGTVELQPGVGVWMYMSSRTWTCIPWHRIVDIQVIQARKDLASDPL